MRPFRDRCTPPTHPPSEKTKITDYKDELDKARLEKEEIVRQKDSEIEQREASIQEQKTKMDEMAKEFGQMLKQTLDKMSEKIVITNDWEADKQVTPDTCEFSLVFT